MVLRDEPKLVVWRYFVGLIAVVVLVYVFWMLFFSYEDCGSWDCFNENLKVCDKTRFIGGEEMVFEYTVLGKSGDSCEVNVVLLQGSLGAKDSSFLEGREMVCDLPFGVVMLPESDMVNCHGLLKEGLQDLMIERLYSYIIDNLGKINLEILDLPESK